MEETENPTPGLNWIPRRGGRKEPRWVCSKEARAAGFRPRTVSLSAHADHPSELAERCQYLQGQMLYWLATKGRRVRAYDGTLSSLIELYQTHMESPYRGLKEHTRRTYDIYLGAIKRTVGGQRLDEVTGMDVKRWHKTWIAPEMPGHPPKIAAGKMAAATLKAVLAFGQLQRIAGSRELKDDIRELRFPSPSPRQLRPTAAQIEALRGAAHARGWGWVALATALQFELSARQWDVIGQWVGIDEPGLSDVVAEGRKWVHGLRWDMIDADGVLTYTPSKTLHRTGVKVVIDLALCPMALEEMQQVPESARSGPIILNSETGLPPRYEEFRYRFRTCAKAAGWPPGLWSRDARAGGISEARDGGADIADAAKAAGHRSPRTTALVYDRAVLEATRRAATARLKARGDK